MAISYRNYSETAGSTGNRGIAKPTGLVDGDMMIGFSSRDSIAAGLKFTDSDGSSNEWTQLDERTLGSTMTAAVSWREAGASEDASGYIAHDCNTAHIVAFSKSAGNWDTPTFSVVTDDAVSGTVTLTAVTAASGDAVAFAFSNDGAQTISTEPATGTKITTAVAGSFSQSAYYELSLGAGSYDDRIIYATADQVVGYLVLLSTDAAAASAFPYHSVKQQRKDMKTLLTM